MPLDLFTFVSRLLRQYLNIVSEKIHSIIYLLTSRSILQGKASHKFVDLSENRIMNTYYTNKIVLFSMCAGNEAFYASLYLLHFTSGPISEFQKVFTFSANIFRIVYTIVYLVVLS